MKEKEISFSQFWEVLKKSFIFVIIAAILGAAVGISYSLIMDRPTYKATASFWIDTTSSSADYFNSGMISAAVSFSSSCVELADMDLPVREAVRAGNLVEKLGYKDEDTCVKKISSMISASKRGQEAGIFNVSVTASTPEVAYEIMSVYQDVFPGVITDLCSLQVTDEKNDFVSLIAPIYSIDSVVKQQTSPITLGLLGGLAAGVIVYAIFFIISIFDNAVYGEKTIKDNFYYPIVGQIPSFGISEEERMSKKKNKKSKNGKKIILRNYDNKLMNLSSPFYVTEAFNSLRTNLVYSAVAEKNPVYVITSDVAGAGKTIVAANLSISFANLGKKVLLVECDMRCPSFSKVFGKKIENGTSELLAAMYHNTEDVVTDVGVESLDVVFGGKIPPNPSELLSSPRMHELVSDWKSKYDIIVLDMPPIGEVFDAGVVSSVVNGYVLAVRCNHSSISDIRESLDRVKAVNGNMLGIVVNDIDPKTSKRYKVYYGSYERK